MRDHPANLHRASDSQQSGLRELEGSQGAGSSDPADLHGTQRRGGHGGTGGLRAGVVGPEVSHRGRRLASGLGPGHSFFTFPPPIRRVIYTTNAIESINARLRKIIKTRGHFPSDDAASKLIWLALRNTTSNWGRAAKDWKDAMNQFAILYAECFEAARG